MQVDILIEELWSGQPPVAATASLLAYVSNLRREFDAALGLWRGQTYADVRDAAWRLPRSLGWRRCAFR